MIATTEIPLLNAELHRGRAELHEEEPEKQRLDHGQAPPPPEPPRRWEFPRFRGGGDGLPRWQRLTILGAMLILSMLMGWMLGSGARVFARGLEAGRANG